MLSFGLMLCNVDFVLLECCMAAVELIQTQPKATREEIREWISGNYCRCTGYHAIVDAIAYVLEKRQLAK
jgi:carbon-monoxide dehydrogenase small subunit